MAANKEEQWRREGMSYALKIAKEKGVEGLEEECRFRGATNIPIPVNRKAIDECIKKIKLNTIDTITILSAITLRDEFEFGTEEVARYIDRFNEKADNIASNYCTWEDNIAVLKEELGMDFSIRRNDKDVKI